MHNEKSSDREFEAFMKEWKYNKAEMECNMDSIINDGLDERIQKAKQDGEKLCEEIQNQQKEFWKLYWER